MWKIISFFNHKWGVGKTTLVHNLAFALADKWKKVLLIDSDPQMNLTAAIYGLSTSIDYSTDDNSRWMENIKKYMSISEYLKQELRGEKCTKEIFHTLSRDNSDGSVDMISGDINITLMEADLYGIIKSRNDFTKDIPYKFEQAIKRFQDNYDFILIDTSPSASSIINALLVISSNYFIAPVSPSFFSLQAVDNLSTIFQNWTNLFDGYQKTTWNPYWLTMSVKFLGIVVQLAKRFNGWWNSNMDWFSASTEDWITNVNTSVKKFQIDAIRKWFAIDEGEFVSIFWDKSLPFIIEKCCDFTPQLRSIAESEWVPVIYLTQDICKKYNPQVDITSESKQYYKSFHQIDSAYRGIANGLLRL